MSKTIDEKVVSMKFDNSHFEKNVRTSMSTLDKLKSSLKFDGATKGFNEISAAAGKCDFAPLSKGLENVKSSFSALEVIGITALANITNSAVNAGKQLVSSLSVDQIAAGWGKYEQKTASVQTIMNATGKSIDEVNGYLDKLMWFSDETSYGFIDMTSALGQMTSSGGEVEALIPMIMGVANATAYAGKGAAEFSRAMFNLNQSYGAGYLQMMDWRSLELAGVAGKQLKQTFIDVAVEQGKIAEGQVTLGNFATTLKDKWADTSVMEAAFGRFSEMTEKAYELVQAGEFDTTAEAIEHLSGQYSELAEKAFKSAQEAKTFTEAIDATKDAVSSGWMNTFEIIFGNYDKAKVLWTDLCGHLWDIFASSGETRNAILSEAFTSKWDKLTEKIQEAGISTEEFENKVANVLETHGYDIGKLIEDYGSLEKAFTSGAVSSDILKEALGGVEKSLANLSIIKDDLDIGDTGDAVSEAQKALRDLGYDLGKFGEEADGVDGIFGKVTQSAVEAFQAANNLKVTGIIDEETLAALEASVESSGDLVTNFEDLIGTITELGGREHLVNALNNSFEGLKSVLGAVKTAWNKVFYGDASDEEIISKRAEKILKLTEAIDKFSERLNINDETVNKITRTFKGLFAILDIIRTVVGGVLGAAFQAVKEILEEMDISVLDVTASIGDFIVKIRDWIKEHNFLVTAFKVVIKFCVQLVKTIKEWIKAFLDIPEVNKFINDFRDTVSEAFVKIEKWISNGADNIGIAFETIKKWFSKGIDAIGEFLKSFKGLKTFDFGSIKSIFEKLGSSIAGMFEGTKFHDTVTKVIDKLKAFKDFVVRNFGAVADKFSNLGEKLSDFAAIAKEKLSTAWDAFKDFMSGVTWDDIYSAGKMIGVVLFLYQMYNLIKNLAELPKSLTNLANDIDVGVKALTKKLKGSAVENFGKIVKDFAIAVALIAGSIYVLAQLDWKEAWKAAVAVAGIMVILGGIAAGLIALTGKFGKDGAIKMAGIGVTLAGLGVGILLMAAALKKLEGVKWDEMKDGLAILAVMLFSLAGASLMMSLANGVTIRTALSLLVLVAALRLMFGVLKKYSELKGDEIENGLNALMLIGGTLTSFLAIIGLATKNSSMFGAALLLISLLGALMYLRHVLKVYAETPWTDFEAGIKPLAVAMGALLAFVAIAGLCAGKSGAMLGAAGVVLALGLSLLLLSKAAKKFGELNDEEFLKGLGSIAVLIVGIYAIILAMSNLQGDKVGKALIGLAIGLAAIAAAILIFGILPLDIIVQGAITVGVMLLALGGALALAGKFNSKSAVAGIIAMTAAVAALAFIVIALGNQPWKELIAPALTIGLLMIALGGSLALAGKFSSWSAVVGILAMSVAIAVLAGSMYILQDVPWEQLVTSALALGVLLMIIAAAMQVAGTFSSLGAGAGLLIASVGILALAAALLVLSQVPIDAIWNGVGALVVMLVALAAVSAVFNYLPLGTILVNATLLVLAASVLIIAAAFTLFAFGLTIVGEALPSVAAGIELMGTAIANFITSIANCEGSMTNFNSVLLNLGSGILVFLGKIALGLIEVAGGIIVFSLACIILSGALITASVGIIALAASFVILSVSIAIGAAAILLLGAAIAAAIDLVLGALGIMTGSMESAGGDVTTGFANGISGGIGNVIEKVTGFVQGVIDTIKNLLGIHSPSTVAHELGENTVEGYANGIDDSSGNAEESAGNFIQKIVDKLKGGEEGFSTEGLSGGSEFLSSFSDGIDLNNLDLSTLNTDQLTEVFGSLGGEAGTSFGTDFTNGIDLSTLDLSSLGGTDLTALFGDKGVECGSALTTGISEGSGDVSIEPALTTMLAQCSDSKPQFIAAGTELAQAVSDGFAQGQNQINSIIKTSMMALLSAIKSSQQYFFLSGRQLALKIQNGISLGANGIRIAFTTAVESCLAAIKEYHDSFVAVGGSLAIGFATGIELNAFIASAAARSMALAAVTAAKMVLDINSPSKVFRKIGSSIPEGFAQGIGMLSGTVEDSVVSMSDVAVSATKDALSHVGMIANSGSNIKPTITPVIDMASLNARNMSLNTTIDASFARPVSSLSQVLTESQAQLNSSNKEVVNAVKGLKEDFAMLKTAIDDKDFAAYLDSKLVSRGLAKPMNRELSILSKRGAYT